MCMVEEAEPIVVLTNTMRTARKEHTCTECDRTITKGERYEYVHGIADGGRMTSKVCTHCIAARQWLQYNCGGYCYFGVLEDLREHWDDEPETRSIWLGRAIIGMQRRWRSLEPLGPAPVLA